MAVVPKQSRQKPKRRPNFTLAQKIGLGFSVVLAILVGISVVAEQSLRESLAANEKLVHNYNVPSNLELALSSIKDVETGQRGFVITGDPAYLAPYQDGIIKLQSVLVRLDFLLQGNTAQLQRLAALREKIFQRTAVAAEIIEARTRLGFDKAATMMRSRRTDLLTQELREGAGAMLGSQWDTLRARNQEVAVHGNRARSIIIYGNTSAVIFVALAALLISRDLIRRDQSVSTLQQTHYRIERRLNEILASRDPAGAAAQVAMQQRLRSDHIMAGAIARLQRILDALEQGVLGVDEQGKCNYVNRRGSELLGVSASELLQRPFAEFFALRSADGTPLAVSPAMELTPGKGAATALVLLQRSDGSGTPLACRWQALRVADRTPGLVVLSFAPTPDPQPRSLAPAADLQLPLTMAEEFSASLNAISLQAELLREDLLNRGQRDSAWRVSSLENLARQVLNLALDARDLMQMESNRPTFKQEDFDVVGVLRGIAKTLASELDEQGNNIAINASDGLAQVIHNDPQKLGKVLLLLVRYLNRRVEEAEIRLTLHTEVQRSRAGSVLQVQLNGGKKSAGSTPTWWLPSADSGAERDTVEILLLQRYCQLLGCEFRLAKLQPAPAPDLQMFLPRYSPQAGLPATPATALISG